MDTLKPPATPTPNDAANEAATPPDTNSITPENGVAPEENAPRELEPGRALSGEEALDRIFEKNAELYRRLA